MDTKQAKQISNLSLLAAAKSGDATALLNALQAGTGIHARDSSGWTALMGAASLGHANCLSLLIEAGADINAKKLNGSTAATLAANYGHADCAQMIEAERERRALLGVVSPPAKWKPGLRI